MDRCDIATDVVMSHMETLAPETVQLRMLMAQLSYDLSPKHLKVFVSVMVGCFNTGAKKGYDHATQAMESFLTKTHTHRLAKKSTNDVKTELAIELRHELEMGLKTLYCDTQRLVPKAVQQVKTELTDGAHSVVMNLPRPPIHRDISGHSYVKPEDCIRDFFGHSTKRKMALLSDDFLEQATGCSVSHFTNSNRAKQCLELLNELRKTGSGATQKGVLMFFTDDVEPNKSNKANRGSVWLAVMTIGTVPGDGHNVHHTYPVAIGKKGDSHDDVLHKLENNMKKVRRGIEVYVGSRKKMVNYQFTEFVHLGDQPERRSLNGLQLGNGTYAARFGVSANHKECCPTIRACENCSQFNLSRMNESNVEELRQPIPECKSCMNWDVLNHGNLGYHTPPVGYPLLDGGVHEKSPFCRLLKVIDSKGREKQVIKPFRVTYDGLKGAVALAHDCYVHHGWSDANATAYLKVETLNTEFIDNFLKHAFRCYSLRKCSNPETGDLTENERLTLEDSKRNPKMYQKVPDPPMWVKEGSDLSDLWPNVIMHLMCLGVIKTVVQRVVTFLTKKKKMTDFGRKNANFLVSMSKMTIQWLTILEWQGVHWVSENYLSFGRVMKWFFQNIDDLIDETPVEIPYNLPQKKWNKIHNQAWLQQRGQEDEGTALELANKVAELMKNQPPLPVLIEPECPTELVENTLKTLHVVLECVFSPVVTEETIWRTHHAVRAFLTAYDKLDSSISGGDNFPFSCCNFASLIDLPDMMRKFGPLRNLWEGGPKGEGYFRIAKPQMKSGFNCVTWHYNLLTKSLNDKELDQSLPREREESFPLNHKRGLWSRRLNFHKYKNGIDFVNGRKNSHPTSVVLVTQQDNTVKIFPVSGEYELVSEIVKLEGDPIQEKFGLHYYQFNDHYNPNDCQNWEEICHKALEIGYGLLLPLMGGDDRNRLDALVASNWKSLSPTVNLAALVDESTIDFS